ncbi:MAG: hypothetical protein M3326_12670 [Actinomycetota bacterium]|nr:hypothetical protein [Actinomycetota bacterium]
MSISIAAGLATGCKLSDDGASPACNAARPEPLFLVAQAVPTAALIPCVTGYPGGWRLGTVDVRDGRARIRLDSDRGGRGALTVTLAEGCDVAGAVEVPTDKPGTARYDGMPDVDDGFRGVRSYRFEGGCVTYSFDVGARRAGPLVDEGALAVGFLSRAEVQRRMEKGIPR